MIAFIGLGLIIFVHEFGHFIAGKLMGLKIREFMFGLPGPRIFSFKWGETEYGATYIPFGGYVRFAGTESELQMEEDEEDRDTPPERKYDSLPKWKKSLVMIAGPVMNLLFPILLVSLLLAVQGQQFLQPVIGEVVKGSAAQEVGIKKGDRIVAANGDDIKTWTDLTDHLRESPGKEVSLTIERGDETLTLTPKLGVKDGRGFLGVSPSEDEKPIVKREPVHLALYKGTLLTYDMTKFLVVTLFHVITQDSGQLTESSRGPVGIIDETARIAKQDFWQFVGVLAFLSINLGVLNLLPIPPLDGGRLAILGVEGIIRRPINKKLVFGINAAGMALLLTLMFYLIVMDVGRIFTRTVGNGGG
ncbi:MAG: RIP metalloprotease RseP [Candidatus Aquicultor sp.]|nr:RIP metalloprotease RseP [Candidatus Aquicultor sp.]